MAKVLNATGDDEAALPIALRALAHARDVSDTSAVLNAAQLLQSMAPRHPEGRSSTHRKSCWTWAGRRTRPRSRPCWYRPSRCRPAPRVTCEGSQLVPARPSALRVGPVVVPYRFRGVRRGTDRRTAGDHEVAALLHGRLAESERLLQSAMQRHFVVAYDTAVDEVRNAIGSENFAMTLHEGSSRRRPTTLRELNTYLGEIESTTPKAARSAPDAKLLARSDGLTDRQIDVVRLLASGMTNKEIASALGVTPKTVMHHTVAIYQKIGVRGRTEAVAWAIRTGVAMKPE
jgi:DNA-binding CsgD family transcriptional regulator